MRRIGRLFGDGTLNRSSKTGRLFGLALLVAGGLFLSACQGGIDSVFPKAEVPIPPHLVAKMKAKGMKASSPILLRIYKSENVLEVWKQTDRGRYALLETYEICKWSGKLGPKFKEGDRQAPEGFYKVGKAQLNPRSEYHLSFNIGFPNTFDRAHGRTGSHLMVHGACSSAGCYSMTDELVEEIYALARDAIKGGQDYFQVQAYPFRMTARNLAKHAAHEHFDFWKMLKEGSDHFELTNYPPKVDVCEKRYLFNREAPEGESFRSREECPAVTMPAPLLDKWKEHLEKEQAEFAKALKRNQLLGTYKDTALASVDVKTISMMAPGSEILPPPTPEPEAEPQTTEPPPDAPVAVSDAPAIDGGIASAAENEAALAGDVPPGQTPAQQGEAAGETEIRGTQEVAGSARGEGGQATVVRAIPVPQRAPRDGRAVSVTPVEQAGAQAAAPAQSAVQREPKKRPWWLRKSKDEPVSLISPNS